MRKSTLVQVLIPALVAASALPVGAQYMALRTPPSAPTVNATRAHELHQSALDREAKVAELTKSTLRPLADLHYRSAMLRSRDDAQAVECLKHAANLLHRHDPARAIRLMTLSADRAVALGDVLGAAHSYLDAAAHIQLHLKDGKIAGPEWAIQADEMAGKARLLSESPLIDAKQRDAIRARVTQARVLRNWAMR